MNIKMFYDNGHFDIFDTDTHVEKVLKGNVITDYSFDLTEREGRELWLTIYFHEAADEFRQDVGPTGVPVAHRRDGWAVLLADADDMARLRRVSVDGETVLVRILDELVDAQTLEYESEMITYYTPRLVNFYDYYLKVLGRKDSPEIDAEACAKLAVSPETMAGLLERDELTRPDEDELTKALKKLLG